MALVSFQRVGNESGTDNRARHATKHSKRADDHAHRLEVAEQPQAAVEHAIAGAEATGDGSEDWEDDGEQMHGRMIAHREVS